MLGTTGLYTVLLSRINNRVGQGLDLAIQAERESATSVSHPYDRYNITILVTQRVKWSIHSRIAKN